MISRSDALLARGWTRGKLSTADLQEVRQAVSGQSLQYTTQIIPPFLSADEKASWEELFDSSAWKAKTRWRSRSCGRPTRTGGPVTSPSARRRRTGAARWTR